MKMKKQILGFLKNNATMINGLMSSEEQRLFHGDVVALLENEIKEQGKKNIAIFKRNKSFSCTFCGCKDKDKLQELTLKGEINLVNSFDVCDNCLKQLKTDIGLYFSNAN